MAAQPLSGGRRWRRISRRRSAYTGISRRRRLRWGWKASARCACVDVRRRLLSCPIDGLVAVLPSRGGCGAGGRLRRHWWSGGRGDRRVGSRLGQRLESWSWRSGRSGSRRRWNCTPLARATQAGLSCFGQLGTGSLCLVDHSRLLASYGSQPMDHDLSITPIFNYAELAVAKTTKNAGTRRRGPDGPLLHLMCESVSARQTLSVMAGSQTASRRNR